MNGNKLNPITVKNAKIIYRNFRGEERPPYNPAGSRTFSLLIEDEDLAMDLLDDGWNVKTLNKRSEDDPQHWHLPVAVVYGKYPPTIRIMTQTSGEILDENTVGLLDSADIVSCDMIIRPRNYEANGRTGVKAYLKSMNVRIEEDELAKDYDKFMNGEEVTPF